ncbi:MAG: thermopsin family protease, partial [Thermoplasmata archaeon]
MTPLYSTAPAPMGVADYGLMAGPHGSVVPYVLNTPSLRATFDPTTVGVQPIYPLSSSPDGYGVQLNAVTTNITLFGHSGYEFWTQNVVEYYAQLGQLYLITNVWNFSNGPLSTNVFYQHGPYGTQVGTEYYYAFIGPITVSYPFNLTLWMNSSIAGGRNEVQFNVGIQSAQGNTLWPYDYVIFNSTAPGGRPLTLASPYTADGEHYNPIGLTNDFEVILGGPGGGAQADLFAADATMGLDFWNSTARAYQSVPTAFNYGGETGETVTGASIGWSSLGGGPIGVVSTGPSLLNGLWGTGTPAGINLVDVHLTPSNAFIFVGANWTSAFVDPTFEWAPTVLTSTFGLSPGDYTFVFVLSNFDPLELDVNVTSGDVSITPILAPDSALGIYTPLWAWNNAQLAAISSSGAGTASDPYVLVNDQMTVIPSIFGIFNDYTFPVFAGVFLYQTTASVELLNPASFEVTMPYSSVPPTNQLQFQFDQATHVALLDASSISGWFTSYLSDFPYYATFNVLFWQTNDSVVAGNTFNSTVGGMYMYGGTGNLVWGNFFLQVALPTSTLPLLQLGLGLMEDESGDLIFNNAFYIAYTAYTPLTDVYTGNFYVPVDLWNVTPQPASNVQFWPGFPTIPITGSIIATSWQGGNFWWDYGTWCNPFNVLPYTSCSDIVSGGDYAPLIGFSLYHVTVSETGLPVGTSWTGTVSDGLGNYYDVNMTSTSSFEVWLPNGSYFVGGSTSASFWAPVAGFDVAGGSAAVSVAFVPTYAVTFNETGLPLGTS